MRLYFAVFTNYPMAQNLPIFLEYKRRTSLITENISIHYMQMVISIMLLITTYQLHLLGNMLAYFDGVE